MKRALRILAAGAVLALCLAGTALPALAQTPDVSGSYHPTRAQALRDLSPRDLAVPEPGGDHRPHHAGHQQPLR